MQAHASPAWQGKLFQWTFGDSIQTYQTIPVWEVVHASFPVFRSRQSCGGRWRAGCHGRWKPDKIVRFWKPFCTKPVLADFQGETDKFEDVACFWGGPMPMHNLLETSAERAINLDDGCDESVGTTSHCLFSRFPDPGCCLKEWTKYTKGATGVK